jgi:hypothetical protein
MATFTMIFLKSNILSDKEVTNVRIAPPMFFFDPSFIFIKGSERGQKGGRKQFAFAQTSKRFLTLNNFLLFYPVDCLVLVYTRK